MLAQTLKAIFNRDLNKLSAEIAKYQTEKNIWAVEDGISNSAGNLCLHLAGNLSHFIGAVLGASGYVRNREAEFSLRDIPKEELLKQIEDTRLALEAALDSITPDQLTAEYPLVVFDKPMTTEYFLVHLAAHLSYHLGQINYHRRLLDK